MRKLAFQEIECITKEKTTKYRRERILFTNRIIANAFLVTLGTDKLGTKYFVGDERRKNCDLR